MPHKSAKPLWGLKSGCLVYSSKESARSIEKAMLRAEDKTSRKIKPTVLDIFCGAGGMSLGFKNAGCEILGGIDHNRYAVDTHHRNFASVRLKLPPQDIRNLRNLEKLGLNSGEVDILIGGPPCQVFSRVGIGKMRKLGFRS